MRSGQHAAQPLRPVDTGLWRSRKPYCADGAPWRRAGPEHQDSGRIDAIDEGLEGVDEGVVNVDEGVVNVDRGVDNVDEGVDNFDRGIDGFDERIDATETTAADVLNGFMTHGRNRVPLLQGDRDFEKLADKAPWIGARLQGQAPAG